MIDFSRFGQGIIVPLTGLWQTCVDSLPQVLGGILLLAFGLLLGEILEIIAIKVLKRMKLNEFIANLNISDHAEKFDLAHILGVILKWYIFVIFLIPAANYAQLGTLSTLLEDFARWFPNLIVAILLVTFGWIAIDVLVQKLEHTSLKSKKLVAHTIQVILFLIVFSVALEQVGISVDFLHQIFLILLSALAFGFALAMGIAFGMGMKDEAKKMVKDLHKKVK